MALQFTNNMKEWNALAELVRAEPKKYWDMIDNKNDLNRMRGMEPGDGMWSIRETNPKTLESDYYEEYEIIEPREVAGKMYVLLGY